ncbi:response regulator transcription factor [Paenibacillus segetis]|uniref:Two-component sensor response regulator n=1 Tax=Paenibacillus segetis TaxID=1325360 RepID=A0ABQ1Y7W5_9BACL|nr:response regulator [Paenibacillus segetis]GGH15505.1 putative two-component sensor response regulator [Paenibacillus segetis]
MINILLVDDETYVTESLALTIPWQEIGVEQVYRAASGKEALAILEMHDIDIVVTDIRMPGMTGLELIKVIMEEWPHIQCMLLTGYSDFEYARKAIQLQAFDYILKPVDDEEFVHSIVQMIETLKDEWEKADKYHTLLYHLKSDYGVLRGNLLHDLLLGRHLSSKSLESKLSQYEIPFTVDQQTSFILLQYGNPYDESDRNSMTLMEYAVGKMAEEIFSESMHVWYGKAPHDCLILMVQLKRETEQELSQLTDYKLARRRLLESLMKKFCEEAGNYLNADLSLMVSGWFHFPGEIAATYRRGISSYYSSRNYAFGEVVYLEDQLQITDMKINLNEFMYKPPTLIHLLESKQWDSAAEKITEVFAHLGKVNYSREHLYEVFLYITNAFMYTAHKQGQFIYEIDHSSMDMLHDPYVVQSLDKLQGWSIQMLEKLRSELTVSDEYAKSNLVKQVQELVSEMHRQDISVKTIADKVYLHPVYLSKVYKAETGESLSNYIIRMRMEQAHYLLKHSHKKIYEITEELGYQNPQYFSKIFRKFYGMTPQEFRDQ